ncbi:MAG: NAD-glutamate dehydrogenase domain-containing protein, partial [Pseudomonadota bacterium]
KILCTEAIRQGALEREARNDLLASMTDDVAAHVLRHNYSQTGALSLSVDSARRDHEALERLMVRLEQRGVLDRTVEGLPSTTEMTQFKQDDRALTRPEIAVLLAWTKIVLFDDLVASSVPDDPYFERTLRSYFPERLQDFAPIMQAHRLKREIIATVLANQLVDTGGPAFLLRLREQSSASTDEIAEAFEIARNLLDADALQERIHALDNQVPAQRQIGMQSLLATSIGQLALNVLEYSEPGSIETQTDRLSDARGTLSAQKIEALPAYNRALFQRRIKQIARDGVSEALAAALSQTRLITSAPLIAHLAKQASTSAEIASQAYLTLGDALSLDRLRASAEQVLREMAYWDRLATRGLIRDLERLQSQAAQLALAEGDCQAWLDQRKDARKTLLSDLKSYTGNRPSFAQLALAADAVRKFMQTVK